MADQKITELTDLSTSVATADILPVVDATDITTKKVTLANIFGLLYPVGSIYISTLSTNPGTLLGMGTWAVFGAGRTLVSLDSTDTDFDAVEETRGEKTHLLTSAESGLVAHTHNAKMTIYGQTGAGCYALTGSTPGDVGIVNNTAADAVNAHNNIQPSIVVYMWKRSA